MTCVYACVGAPQELKAKRERAETEVRDTRERDRVMQEHLRNVKQELQHTQARARVAGVVCARA